MANPATVAIIKTDLRISHSKLDAEVGAHIDACLKDLETTAGIRYPQETDELILNACRLWCRANMTDDTAKGAAYMQRYGDMKAALQMAGGYGLE